MKLKRHKGGMLESAGHQNLYGATSRFEQALIHLQLQDSDRIGYIREDGIEKFIHSLIHRLQGLRSLPGDFIQFYVYTASRRFMFILDPSRRGRIYIPEILSSNVLEEFITLSEHNTSKTSNWFAVESAHSVYSKYLDMDVDADGMLSKEEIMKYPGSMLTSLAVERLLQEHLSFESMIDYKGYLDLILALTYPSSPSSVRYLWQLLDIKKQGRFGLKEATPFLEAIFESLKSALPNAAFHLYRPEKIFREMLDSAGVIERDFFVLEDMIRAAAKSSLYICHHLVDAHAFYQHDNRESHIADKLREST
jgi:hypothetical protein